MKKTAFLALPLAAALALTGCGAQEKAATPSQGATDQTAAASGSAAAPAAEAKQLSAQQVEAVVSALKDDEPTAGAQVLNDAVLKAGAGQMEQLVAGMKVDPEVCGSFASSGMSEILDSVNMASLVVPTASVAASTTVSVASYGSVSDVKDLAAKQQQSFKDCATFNLEIKGNKTSATLTDTKASTDADSTLASLGEIKFGGETMKTLSVYGMDGNNTVVVTLSEPKDIDAAVAKAEETINTALKLIDKQ